MNGTSQLVKKRLNAISVLVLFISGAILWRMFDVQIIKHEHYLALAQDQQRFEKIELAERGKILVHDSYFEPEKLYPLAFDVKRYDIWAVPHNIKDKSAVADKLARFLSFSRSEIYEKINNDKIYIPPLKRGLTYDEAAKVKSEKIGGVLVVPAYGRSYPENTLASHLLGFVNAEGEGKYGFEGYYNDELKGLAGEVRGEKDTLGRIINLLDQKKPQDGSSFVLTLDRSVQYFVEKKLSEAIEKYQADSGSVVIVDSKSGGIIALAATPNYDPNNFREFANKDAAIFINPVIAHLYEPGSVFKPIIMAAALDSGAVAPETENVFGDSVQVSGYTISTAEKKAFGRENMAEVLQNSDNVAMVWVSELLGKEKMYEYIKNFSFFDKTGIDLQTEAVGYAKALKQWKEIDRATISFGQGINITPIELLAAYNAIANKGVYLAPYVVDKVIGADGAEKAAEKKEGKRVISETTALQLMEMLTAAVDRGHAWRAGVPGFRVAAKTGTAQIAGPNGYEESEDGLGIFNHSLAGFAPAEEPRFTMLVKLERPKSAKYAENTAGPLFGEIASFLLNYYYRATPTR